MSLTINIRDYDFIERRLIAPAQQGREALERLRTSGQHDLYAEMMSATQTYIDATHEIRRKLAQRQR